MNLIIVESPTKAKTISKFLGANYKVESSFGHIRDLPKSEMGVDIEGNFAPKYIIPAKARKNVTKLKELAKKADSIILATDEDREGEAIAWHLAQALGLIDSEQAPKSAAKAKRSKANSATVERIVFHEITKKAIEEALANPRTVDMNLVDAQQARRVLDRLVGYELSPFLWKKVAKGLSAGRVQSVAVRLIVERERAIQAFKAEEYWSIAASLKSENDDRVFLARLNKIGGKTLDRLAVKDKNQADKILEDLNQAAYQVEKIDQKSVKKNPPKPFTTSSLQQTANRWLGFSARQTMMLAQQLYEGVELGGKENAGLITYMRTDSLNLSEKFLEEANVYLTDKLGKNYAVVRRFKTKTKGAQEAHEAIRPTAASLEPEAIKSWLNPNQYKLYKLIWQRSLASQMAEAEVLTTAIDIDAFNTPYQFRANGQILKFDGFLKIYPEKSQEVDLPPIKLNERLELIKLNSEQHFTKPPARFSDAGLVKALEQYGIGRPSTYAPTIATIIDRNYASRDQGKRLAPTDIAFVVNDLLAAHFPQIVDYQFTAKMENDLDNIASGQMIWQPVIKEFYEPWHANLDNKYKEINKKDLMPEEKSDQVCDKCGAPMIIKTGRYGKFLACSAFPECKNIKSLAGDMPKEKSEEIKKLEAKYKDEVCDKCGSPMAIKSGRYGAFLACAAYPKCKNIKNIAGGSGSTGITCPVCGQGEIVQKRSRKGVFYACDQYPNCKTAFWGKPTGEKCPDCGSLLVEVKDNQVKCSNKECGYVK